MGAASAAKAAARAAAGRGRRRGVPLSRRRCEVGAGAARGVFFAGFGSEQVARRQAKVISIAAARVPPRSIQARTFLAEPPSHRAAPRPAACRAPRCPARQKWRTPFCPLRRRLRRSRRRCGPPAILAPRAIRCPPPRPPPAHAPAADRRRRRRRRRRPAQVAERTDYRALPQPVRYEELQREVMSESIGRRTPRRAAAAAPAPLARRPNPPRHQNPPHQSSPPPAQCRSSRTSSRASASTSPSP